MAVQVDRTLAHVAPRAEWIVAQHEPNAIDSQFRVILNAVPPVAAGYGIIVVVARDEVLSTIQHV